MVDRPDTMVDLPDTLVDLPDTMVYLPDTIVDLPDTMVDILDTVVDIPDTMVDLPGTMIPGSWFFLDFILFFLVYCSKRLDMEENLTIMINQDQSKLKKISQTKPNQGQLNENQSLALSTLALF